VKIYPINNNFNITTNIQNKNVSNASFRALSWIGGDQVNRLGAEKSNEPLSFTQQMLNYGFEALDENTLFITTTNEAKSNYALNQYKDKIGVPILKTYTLDIIPELNKDWSEETDRNFAFFKKDDEYYILSLASMFGTSLINPKTKEKYDLRPGEVKKLENGTEILAFISLDFNNKIIFEKPSAYRTSNAKKYLHYSTVDPIAHNTRAVSALTSPKSQKADKGNAANLAPKALLAKQPRQAEHRKGDDVIHQKGSDQHPGCQTPREDATLQNLRPRIAKRRAKPPLDPVTD
jgi:hypothetical protein